MPRGTYSGRAAALTSASDDKLISCRISWKNSSMADDRLREKAVLTAIEAVKKVMITTREPSMLRISLRLMKMDTGAVV